MSPTSRPIASEARSPHAYISSSSARSRSAAGSEPRGWASRFLTSPWLSTWGSFLPRRGAVSAAVGSSVDEVLAAQVLVERAQAGRLAVDRRRRARRALVTVAGRQLGEELGDVERRRVGRADVALGEKAPVLEKVGAIGGEGVVGQPALELEVGEEVEDQRLEARVGALDASCRRGARSRWP